MLSKGLSFIPTARDVNSFEVLADFNKFAQKLRNQACQFTPHPNQDGFNLFKKTQQQNSQSRPTKFLQFENTLEHMKLALSNLPCNVKVQSNLSHRQKTALISLCKNKHIVINKADKGSTVVIQNRSDYITDAMFHLNDTITYQPLTGDPTQHICSQIRNILHEYYKKFYLIKNMYTFCLPPDHARLARIYFLKKIHKTPVGIRLIVSSCESPTENISQFIDYWLQPHTRLLSSFLKDTNQFILEMEKLVIPPNSLLATIDVKSLYTNIPHDEGIKACSQAFIKLEKSNPQQPPAEILVNLLEIVLKNNTFEFNNQCFKQLYGIAMGTKLAPAYANTFMG